MNLRQLNVVCEVVDGGLILANAARVTHRSQSAVTRQIQVLERELGFDIFTRRGRKLIQLTPAGEELVEIARRMLRDHESLLNIGGDQRNASEGKLTIATTNFHARYALPGPIRQFVKKYPNVRLSLRQGTPAQCSELIASGKADLAICAAGDVPREVVQIPCYRLNRSVITPPRHPLLRTRRLTVEAIARYPLITFDEAFSGSWLVLRTFTDRGLDPSIALSAADADVSKLYVGMGLGIAIFATIAFDRDRDTSVRRIDARHLFPPSYLSLLLRRQNRLRTFAYDFVQMFAPKVDRAFIQGVVLGTAKPPDIEQLPEM